VTATYHMFDSIGMRALLSTVHMDLALHDTSPGLCGCTGREGQGRVTLPNTIRSNHKELILGPHRVDRHLGDGLTTELIQTAVSE
jgi:hypothetical protein